jgi:hypothetical protein
MDVVHTATATLDALYNKTGAKTCLFPKVKAFPMFRNFWKYQGKPFYLTSLPEVMTLGR